MVTLVSNTPIEMKTSPFQSVPKGKVVSPANQGFTLIELLMVIAIILVLAGITFGVSRGVYNAQARAGAKADLAAIAQGLEQFKSVFGDYPITDNPATSDTRIKQSNQRLVLSMRGELVGEKTVMVRL